MSATPRWLRPLDHTADEEFVVSASTRKQLFERAAWGMFALLVDMSAVQCRIEESVTVESPDTEALLVAWLSELNFRHTTRHRVYGRFKVLNMDSRHLTAVIAGEPVARSRHVIHGEIKAVTYHQLRIWRRGRTWRARVLFDV